MAESRKLKIFVASPADVAEERTTLAKLVADINDVLAYLAPEKQLALELVRYETHSYPDIGRPQEVINREIPVDYDIFVGIMWKRAGTPTAAEPSGTIEEFRRASQRRLTNSLPRIMFYFCDQPIPMPTSEDIKQLAEVIKFREELQSLGLTSTYPTHAEFGEHVRGGLLRAIRDILRDCGHEMPLETTVATPVTSANLEEAQRLVDEYEQTRRDMPKSDDRTRVMEGIFGRMKALAPRVRGAFSDFKESSSPGKRLVAVAILNMFPSADELDWLATRLDPECERPFVQYYSAVALLEASIGLPASDCEALTAAVVKAKRLIGALEPDSDRGRVLNRAEQELARKCHAS